MHFSPVENHHATWNWGTIEQKITSWKPSLDKANMPSTVPATLLDSLCILLPAIAAKLFSSSFVAAPDESDLHWLPYWDLYAHAL